MRDEFMKRFTNSAVISLGASALAIVLGSLAAYGLTPEQADDSAEEETAERLDDYLRRADSDVALKQASEEATFDARTAKCARENAVELAGRCNSAEPANGNTCRQRARHKFSDRHCVFSHFYGPFWARFQLLKSLFERLSMHRSE